MANKRIKDLATTKYKGFMALDDADGTGKMDVATIFNNFGGKFMDNVTEAKAGKLYMHNGSLYEAEEDYQGVWDASKFIKTDVDTVCQKLSARVDDILSFVDYDLSDATSGYYYDASGNLVANAESYYKNISFTSADEGKFVTISTNRVGTISDTRYYVLFDSNGVRIDVIAAGDIKNIYDDLYTFPVPVENGWVLKASWRDVVTPTIKRNDKLNPAIAIQFKSLNDRTDALDIQINGKTIYSDIDLSGATIGYYYNASGNLVADSSSAYKDITFAAADAGKYVTISTNRVGTISDSRRYLLYNSNNVLVKQIAAGEIKNDYNDLYMFELPVQTGWVLKASWNKAVTPSISYIESYTPSLEERIVGVGYVSTTGNDTTGDGSSYNPFKTLSKAIENGHTEIVIDGGIYTDDQIDLSKTKSGKLTIKGIGSKKVIFKRSSALLVNSGAEELVTGYSNVYSVDSSSPGYSGDVQLLFFDGLNDETTAISAESAHPLERGLFYRNDCAKIVKCTSATLADALNEIENSDSFKWFYDNGKLYFNRSNSDTSVYPIYRANGSYLVCKDNLSLDVSNIEFRYGRVNLEKLNIVNMYNVSCKYVYAYGAFAYTNCLAVTFDHCEAAACFMGVNGDGFNGNASTTEIGSKCSQVTLRECWSHDNNDDGYSDHGNTEATLDGGLFEYNRKGGVTPSYGCHCVCKNTYSRHNYNGFYYTGTATDSGNAGQMACYDCVSENNNESSSSSNGGFKVNGTGNKAILVNCKSLNDHIAFRIETGYAKIIDCGYVGADLAVVSGGGTVEKIKTTLAE